MGEDLLTLAREHDLPPRWDGFAVVWEPWRDDVSVLICPPLPHAGCASCHADGPRMAAGGLVCARDWLDHSHYAAETAAILSGRRRHRLWQRALRAVRCTACRHDQVVDMRTGQVWDLDHTDYGDDGSNPP